MASFAGIAPALTVVGIYGLLSYTVTRRRHEIGLRIALGARRREVVGIVLWQAGRLVLAGTILGLAGAAGAQRLLKSIVFGARAGDPVFLLSASAVMRSRESPPRICGVAGRVGRSDAGFAKRVRGPARMAGQASIRSG